MYRKLAIALAAMLAMMYIASGMASWQFRTNESLAQQGKAVLASSSQTNAIVYLSGGGTNGLAHIGFLNSTLPRLPERPHIVGASAGAIGAALVASRPLEVYIDFVRDFMTREYVEMLHEHGSTLVNMAGNFFHHGTLTHPDKLPGMLSEFFGNMTFQEAFAVTGILLSIVVTHADSHEAVVLSHLNAPAVLLASAVQASASVPVFNVFGPVALKEKTSDGSVIQRESFGGMRNSFIDGSVSHDIPRQQIEAIHGPHLAIVSQVNFHGAFLAQLHTAWPSMGQMLATMGGPLGHFAHSVGMPSFGFVFSGLTQTYSGDVTVIPDQSVFSGFFGCLHNPDRDLMTYLYNIGFEAAERSLSNVTFQTDSGSSLLQLSLGAAEPFACNLNAGANNTHRRPVSLAQSHAKLTISTCNANSTEAFPPSPQQGG